MLVQWGEPTRAVVTLAAAVAAHGVTVSSARIRAYVGVDAVRHLLSLAAGLESSRVGEQEILGQLRSAWGNAWLLQRPDPAFDRILQQVIGASRYVRAVFPASSSAVTLGEEAVTAVETARGSTDWSTRRVLVIGTGSAATSALAALRRVRPGTLAVMGRTAARVKDVAERFGARPYWWADRRAVIAAHDVVVFAVRTTVPIVDDTVRPETHGAVWVDLGLPAAAVACPGVTYVGLSALHAAVAADPARAQLGREAVEAELRRLVQMMASRQVA